MPKPLHSLIVEDSEDDALLLLRELKKGGYEPVFERVETPEAMKAALEKGRWDIIISDYVLPRFSGLAALDILKESGQDLPFIIVSGNIGEDIAVGAMKSGAHDYIIKGNLARLVPAVERELREAEVRRARSRADRLIKTTNELLKLFPGKYSRREYLESVVKIISEWSGCRCVGVRVVNERGEIPYESYCGFDYEFWNSESCLSISRDQCICIRVVNGKPDPLDIPSVTEAGSFRCDNTIKFIEGLTEDEKKRYRGVCIQRGFTSLAVVPVRFLDRTFAAIHLADEREAMVPVETIEALETMTPLIGEAIHRFNVEDELMKNFESLRKTNELLENVFSNVHVLIAYMDSDFNFIRVNSKYAETDGRKPEFFTGKNHFALYPHEENEAIFKKVVETGEPYFVRARPFVHSEHPDRGMTFWDWSIKPVKDADGRTAGLVLSLVDVTENITLYAELMRSDHLASIGKLAAGVAHEINNPINGIINYTQLLINKFDRESKEYDISSRIIKESDRIAGIVRNLLSFARDNKGEKRPSHLREILSDSLALAGTQMRKDGIQLTINVPPDLPQVVVQPQHIEQVFLNIIHNARYALNKKYPEAYAEGKTFEITAETLTIDDKPFVRIIFYDQGTGIPSGILNKIMNPFFTTKPDGEGTGLGLSISHGIISNHGGKLTVDSIEGKYTKVIIDLPL